MHHHYDHKPARSVHDAEVYPARVYERQPNFILMAVVAFAIFLMLTSYLGK